MQRSSTLSLVVASLLLGRLSSAQEVKLGAPTARSAESFTRIVGLRELKDGSVLVADIGDQRIAILPPTLQGARLAGRQGQGPREFAAIGALLPGKGDTTIMADGANQRIVYFAPNGEIARAVGFTSSNSGFVSTPIVRGSDATGALYAQGLATNTLKRVPGVRIDSAPLVRYRELTVADTVAWVRVPVTPTSVSRSGQQFQFSRPRPDPFAVRDDWTVLSDGSIAIARGEPYRLEIISSNGRHVSGAPITVPRIAVTELDRSSASSGAPSSGSSFGGSDRPPAGSTGAPPTPSMDYATVKPPFVANAVRADGKGRIWVARTRPAEDRVARYDVFDATGKRVMEVSVPNAGIVVGFGVGAVYIATADDNDLLHLSRHPLP